MSSVSRMLLLDTRGWTLAFDAGRGARSSLPLKRGGRGGGSRPPPDRYAVDLPLSGGRCAEPAVKHKPVSRICEFPSRFRLEEGQPVWLVPRISRQEFLGHSAIPIGAGMAADTNMKRIAVLPGDGIGPEVIGQARRVLDWFVEHRALAVDTEEAEYGVDAYRRHGEVLPEATRAAIERADLVLFGATGGTASDPLPPDKRRAGSLP